MKSRSHRIARILTLAAVTTAAASWSTASYACSPEPYLSAVCVLAWGRNDLRGYLPANGQILSISQNTALFALLGTSYGGNGAQTFAVPDLRGRTVIGAGQGIDGINYVVGQTAGSANLTLTQAQMPTHVHTSAAVNLSGVTTNIDLSKVTGATAALNGVPFTVDSSQLKLRGSSATAGAASPANGVPAVPTGPANRIYGSAPDVDLAANALSGAITVSSTATAPVTLPGSVNVTLSGTAPAAGPTGATGGNTAFSNMQPYLAMYYFIAVQGVFPSSN